MRSSSSESEVQQQDNNDQHTKALHEMCAMIIHIFRSPVLLPIPISLPYLSNFIYPSQPCTTSSQITPAAFGSLFIGISVALMMFGSVTFVIGFILMPVVIMLVMLFYFVGIVSNLSRIFRAVLWPGYDSANSCNNKVSSPGWRY